MRGGASKKKKIRPEDELVTTNRGIALMVSWRWARRTGVDRDELEQQAMIGLLKAARAFDPQRGCKFSTLAVPYCQGEILHFLRDRCTGNGLIRLPYHWREMYPRGRKLLDKGLTDSQVAEKLGMSLEEWEECRVASTANSEELQDERFELDPDAVATPIEEEPIAANFQVWTMKALESLPKSDQKALTRWASNSRAKIPTGPLARLHLQFRRVQWGKANTKLELQLSMFDEPEGTTEKQDVRGSPASQAPQSKIKKSSKPRRIGPRSSKRCLSTPSMFTQGLDIKAQLKKM